MSVKFKLGVITGLIREADCLCALAAVGRPLVRCSGPGFDAAFKTAEALVFEGCNALISFGVAGGLDGALEVGDLLVADSVITAAGGRLQTDNEWRDKFVSAMTPDVSWATAPLAGANMVIASSDEKRRMFADTGALAVDMESHAIGEVAAAANVPFLVIRAISDPVNAAIPRSALKGIGKYGEELPLMVLAALLLRPWELPGLLRLKQGNDKALATLRRVVKLAGSGFGLY